MQVPMWLGLTAIAGAILSFGFLSVPFKVLCIKPRRSKEGVHVGLHDMILIQYFMSFPILFATLIPLTVVKWEVSVYGIYGSGMWVTLSLISILCVKELGLSVSQAVWSGITMVTAFVVGITVFGETFTTIYPPIIGFVLLVIALVGISLVGLPFRKKRKRAEDESDVETHGEEARSINASLTNVEINGYVDVDAHGERESITAYTKAWWTKRCWIMAAIIGLPVMGLLNGMSMIPAKADSGNWMYIVTFGISQFVILNVLTPIYLLGRMFICGSGFLSRATLINSAISGVSSGSIWAVGYYCQVLSVFSKFGLSVGFILVQVCIVISTLNGMILFKELKGWVRKVLFGTFVLVALGGAFLLFYFRG